uniref:DUF5600 domain-containing protein n=1 Tax=Panagrolaimus davidi TaxID=227884 RepID=A0A914PV38_9BILA
MLRDKKLKAIFLDIKLKYRMAESDMPDYETFKDHAQKSYLKSWNRIKPKMLLKLEEFLMKDVTKICENLPNDDSGAASLKREFDIILEQRNEAIEALAAEKAASPANNNVEEKKEASKKASIRKEASKKASVRKEVATPKKKESTGTKSATKSPQVDVTQKED